MELKMNTLSRAQYENCQVLSPEGLLMFRTYERKGNWYLKRNLATKLSDNPLIIQLKFIPKGLGHAGDPYYIQERENKCVVCGSNQDLTKHHIVPRCYRKFFSQQLKEHCAYDVLPLCANCHSEYENQAFILKKQLEKEYNAPISGVGLKKEVDQPKRIAIQAAVAIIRYADKMPEDRKNYLYKIVEDYLGHKANIEELKLLYHTEITYYEFLNYKHHGKIVVDQINDIEAFVKRWRNHFLKSMNPKHLPQHWTVDRSLYNS